MMRVVGIFCCVSSAMGDIVAPTTVSTRNLEGEGHKTTTVALPSPMLLTTCASYVPSGVTTGTALPGIHKIEFTTDGIDLTDDLKDGKATKAGTGWSRQGSFLPYLENVGTDAAPGVCHPTKGWHQTAVACGIITADEECGPAPCKGEAAKVGDPCCASVPGYQTLGQTASGQLEVTKITAGDLCRDARKGSLCGPWHSSSGYDKGDENTGLCEETIFDVPIVLFVAICAVALVIIFFQCSLMGLYDLLSSSKEESFEDDEKRP